MTVLVHSISIAASPERVWSVLGSLSALDRYDPGVARSSLLPGATEGIGAARRCELRPRGWFAERVTRWEPGQTLAFELYDCSLPVRRLAHRYTLTATGGRTVIEQRMEYQLKYGMLGRLLDVVLVRRAWRRGIRRFLAGLKEHVEGAPPAAILDPR